MAQQEYSPGDLSSIYQPLLDENTIRILILNPGEDDDPLSGVLETARLIGRRRASATPQAMWSADRPYEAISYVWGSNIMGHLIYLDGKVHKITANLSDALRQCRLLDQPRALWADSICIDQADLKEKGHQVALMSRIYSCSQRTLICLGSDPKHQGIAQQAFSILSEANKMIERTFQDANFTWGINSFPWPDAGDALVNDSRWQSLLAMMELDWFRRGWVVQEVALGREALILWAGFDLPWSILSKCELWYYYRVRTSFDHANSVGWSLPMLFDQAYAHQRHSEIETFREHRLEHSSILNILDAARSLTLSDPRDRIYAFTALPLLKQPVPALEPDYEQSHLEIYQAFAVRYLELTSNLNILLCVQHDERISDTVQGNSWVPNWDSLTGDINSHSLNRIGGFGDSATDLCTFTIAEGKPGASPCLHVKAVLFDSIMIASVRLDKIWTIEDVAALWHEMQWPCSIDPGQNRGNATVDPLQFLKAYSHGYYHGPSQEESNVVMNAYARIIDKSVFGEPDNAEASVLRIPADVRSYHKQMLLTTGNSKICLLSRNYFGFGPWVVEEGDICAFVFGVESPLILRSVPERPAHHYKVVGPAYVASKQLNEDGFALGLNYLDAWHDWDRLCENEGLRPLNLKVEDIILC